jgi:hypothetical protein
MNGKIKLVNPDRCGVIEAVPQAHEIGLDVASARRRGLAGFPPGILGILGGVADRIRYAGHSGHSCMRGNVCWSDFSQPNPRLAHPGSSCHGRQSIVGATMRPLTNIGLYKIAHSMAVESVETRGTNFLFQKLQ